MSDVLGNKVLELDSPVSPRTPAPGEIRWTRSRFSRLSLLGAGLVGALAKTWVDAPDAAASPYCCNLAFPNGPWCGGTQGSGNFTCPSGYYKQFWTCCAPAGLVSCWECTTDSSTCEGGSYVCSNYSIGPGC